MKIPKPLKITSRTSSITNSFVQAIIPSVEPTSDERREALTMLGMGEDKLECIYCGTSTTDWDHLRPLVKDKKPTGYITEIRNLVPSCGTCNQSKGGSDWKSWMLGKATKSPTTKRIADISRRMERLEKFEAWGNVEPLSLEELAGAEHWNIYWQHLETIWRAMSEAQKKADEVQATIRQALNERRQSTPASAIPQAGAGGLRGGR